MNSSIHLLVFALGTCVVFVPCVWLIVVFNGLVRRRNACDESWSSIDAELQRRYDLVPNLVESVRAYAAHERATLEAVSAARSRAAANHGEPESQARDENAMIGELRRLFAVVEGYPTLKSDGNFLALQQELALTEDRIARARRFYNANVRDLNVAVASFPTNFIAGPFGFGPRQFFEIEDHVRAPPTASPAR